MMRPSSAIWLCPRYLAVAFGRANAQIAPFDVRCLIALLCLPLAYKIVSLDFTALGDLCQREPLYAFRPAWLADLFTANRCVFFSGQRTRVLSIVAALLLVAFVARPRRALLVPAIVLVWLLDTGATQYRFTLYTIDTPLALLTLLCLLPVRLREAAAWDYRPSRDAQIAMLVCLIFVATYYVQAGISKFMFDWRWPWVVRTGNYFPLSWVWHGQVMADWMDPIAQSSAQMLRTYPLLDTTSGWIVLIEQFVWLLALFSMTARVHAGLFAAAYHAVVLVMTGIAFVTWIPVALGVTIPFSRLVHWWRPDLATRGRVDSWAWSWKHGAAVVLASLAAWLPAGSLPVPPFHNYLQFGWRYPSVAEAQPFYRIGFRHRDTGAIDIVGLNQGAFLDFRHSAGMDIWAKILVEMRENPSLHDMSKKHIESLLIAARVPESNGWLLGRWRSPDHLIGKTGPVAMVDLKEFLILRGTPVASTSARPATAAFEVCGRVDFDRAERKAQFTLEARCGAR